MISLPTLMVAPNGARRTKADHPAIPMTLDEIVRTAASCYLAGAGGIHAHVRDETGAHVLDAGLYKELIAELTLRVPHMIVQITTEAVGRYSPADQYALLEQVVPRAVSVSLREMIPLQGDESLARRFYGFCRESEINIQHILYSPEDVARLSYLVKSGVVPPEGGEVLFVLGRYTPNQESAPAALDSFLTRLRADPLLKYTSWMICAFGKSETACLLAALKANGKVRVGFENSLWNADGSTAEDNAERVTEIASHVRLSR